jgi:predicted amidophosphoribosyltransferase
VANFCQNCAQPVGTAMNACPNCGAALTTTAAQPAPQGSAKDTLLNFVGLMLVVIVAGYFLMQCEVWLAGH